MQHSHNQVQRYYRYVSACCSLPTMEYDPKQLFHHISVHVLALFRISLYVSSCPIFIHTSCMYRLNTYLKCFTRVLQSTVPFVPGCHVLEGVEDFWWLPHFLDGARESEVGSGISREYRWGFLDIDLER